MEARCSKCAFPVHVTALGEEAKCPACGFRGTASKDDRAGWLWGLLGAVAVISIAKSMKEER